MIENSSKKNIKEDKPYEVLEKSIDIHEKRQIGSDAEYKYPEGKITSEKRHLMI